MRRVYKNLCPATISASIMAANMWKNCLKNVESDNNKILYETLLDCFLHRNGSYFLNKPRCHYCCSNNSGCLNHIAADASFFLARFYKINLKIHFVPLIAACRLSESWITCGQQLTGMNNANLREFRSNYWLGCIPVSREELLQKRSLEYADVGKKNCNNRNRPHMDENYKLPGLLKYRIRT